MTILERAVVTVVACAVLGAGGARVSTQERGASAVRQRPPGDFSCPPDRLTSYTGLVTAYSRTRDRTTLRIATDWDTTEKATVRHPGSDDPTPWFRFAGGPFADSDWGRIEERRGRLRSGTRATAWVCEDGRVVIDWEKRKE